MSAEPFTFGIPLIARASAPDWELVRALLALTLASVAAQTAGDARVVVAGHDHPELDHPGLDAPFTFLRADWDADEGRAANLDSGRKKSLIAAHVSARGGGLLMLLDADDWVDVDAVARARAMIHPADVGGVIERGHAIDVRTARALALPDPTYFAKGFDQLCGSSTIARLDPGAPTAIRRDPYAILHEHYQWAELCRAHDVSWVSLPLAGAYVVNTGASHSERHGAFAPWRADFNRGVARDGFALDDAVLARFGLSLDALHPLRARLGCAHT